jgi:hypothetical protein
VKDDGITDNVLATMRTREISLLSFYFVLGRDFTHTQGAGYIGMTISGVKL